MKINKILGLIVASALVLLPLSVKASDLNGFALGLTMSSNDISTDGKEISPENLTRTTKSFDDSVTIASIMFEGTKILNDKLAVTLGLDYIPASADLDTRSQSDTDLLGTGVTSTSGTNKVEASVQDIRTLYLQPGIAINDTTMVYGTIGVTWADVEAKQTLFTSTSRTTTQTTDGMRVGVGVKKVMPNGLFIKLDYSQTDMDTVSYRTTDDTRVDADLDVTTMAFSIGRQF